MRIRSRHFAWLILLVTLPAMGETASLLLLHTNDVHDHVRSGYEGVGGLPYVAGYVEKMKAERQDVLLLDAGDLMEKGDMVSFATNGLLTYETMDRIGYDAITVGNHEAKYGIDHLRACQAHMPHVPILCLNWLDDTGKSLFPASKVFNVHGVKVAVIGMTLPKKSPIMDVPETGKALEAEAERLKTESDIQVAIGHLGSGMAEKLCTLAPEVDVFVSAHTHELLRKPKVAEKTGAIIVQAGMYAQYVGRLALTVDLTAKKITAFDGEVVEMRHDSVPCDTALQDWVVAREKELCPEAARVVGHSKKQLVADDMAKLAAVAIQQRAGTDVAFCHTSEIMRSGLPQGDIDVNALFRTGGQRGHKLVHASLTGEQINSYMLGLLQTGKGISQWAGFKGTIVPSGKRSDWKFDSTLKADKIYTVAMPELEWKARFEKVLKGSTVPDAQPYDFSFTDAIAAYVESITKAGKTIDAEAESLGVAHAATMKADDEN